MNYQQNDWAALLPAVEFTYNNAPSMTTGISPFFVNKGYHPRLMVDSSTPVTSARAQQFTDDLDSIHTKLKSNIVATQECYQKSANWHQAPALDFQLRDKVYVKAKFFRTNQLSKKLREKNLGPYKIISTPGSHLFTLRLPQHFWSVHLVFHISQLEPATPNPFPLCSQPPPPPVEVDGVSSIIVSWGLKLHHTSLSPGE